MQCHYPIALVVVVAFIGGPLVVLSIGGGGAFHSRPFQTIPRLCLTLACIVHRVWEAGCSGDACFVVT